MKTEPEGQPKPRRSFADTALSLTEVAPEFPPSLVSHGLELTHQLRRALGDRSTATPHWEELLALRRGPGADAFVASPLPTRGPRTALLLERSIEIRALVDALQHHRDRHPEQRLDRILRQGALATRREALDAERWPVAVRLGAWFTVVQVGEEHPRALAQVIHQSLLDDPRELRPMAPRPIAAPVIVAVHPLPLAESKHLHRVGIEGPWLGWSEASGARPLGVLSAHHLVLDGPTLASLRSDVRRRTRALRVALGLEAEDEDWELLAEAGVLGAISEADGPSTGSWLPASFDVLPDLDPSVADDEIAAGAVDPRAHQHAFAPGNEDPPAPSVPWHAELPPDLRALAERRPVGWVSPTWLRGRMASPPALRFATINRGAFSVADLAYAYCRAQHDALAVHHDRYSGQGFTFVVPWPRKDQRRAVPVLCSFRTRRGAPEGSGTFKRRLIRRMEEAEAGEDLLTQVLDDAFRLPVPSLLRAAAVRLLERLPGDGGSFLTGRGLVSWMEVPDEYVDPISASGGAVDGLFAGSCHERGGVSLTCIDRGFRRDLCAVGTGIFRLRAPFDLFWRRLAFFLGEQGM